MKNALTTPTLWPWSRPEVTAACRAVAVSSQSSAASKTLWESQGRAQKFAQHTAGTANRMDFWEAFTIRFELDYRVTANVAALESFTMWFEDEVRAALRSAGTLTTEYRLIAASTAAHVLRYRVERVYKPGTLGRIGKWLDRNTDLGTQDDGEPATTRIAYADHVYTPVTNKAGITQATRVEGDE